MIDWSVYPDWYSDVIHEAAERGCPEAMIINEELQKLAAEKSEILRMVEELNAANNRYRKALEEIVTETIDQRMDYELLLSLIEEIAERALDDE